MKSYPTSTEDIVTGAEFDKLLSSKKLDNGVWWGERPETKPHVAQTFKHIAGNKWLQLTIACILLSMMGYSLYEARIRNQPDIQTAPLTGVRALFAAAVFLEHSGAFNYSNNGYFLVLSGCVLALSREGKPNAMGSDGGIDGLVRFWFMRFVRILPAYWVWLTLCTCELDINAILKLPFEGRTWLWYTDHTTHIWYVQTCMCLYFMHPVLEAIVRGPFYHYKENMKVADWVWAAVLFVTVSLLKFASLYYLPDEGSSWKNRYLAHIPYFQNPVMLYTFPLFRLPDYMLGMLIPALWCNTGDMTTSQGHRSQMSSHLSSIKWGTPILSDALFVAAVCFMLYHPNPGSLLMRMQDLNAQAPLTAIILGGMCFGPYRSWVGKFFALPPVMMLGESAYGTYLFHRSFLIYMNLLAMRQGMKGTAADLAGTYVITAFCGLVLFRTVEKPCGWLARFALKQFPSKTT